MKTEEIKNKTANTCFQRYGVNYIPQTEESIIKREKTCLERYGVKNAIQNAKIAEKSGKNAYNLKEFVFPCGSIIKVQGYEPYLLKFLANDGYAINDILVDRNKVPEIWYLMNDKIRRYYCDVYIPKNNTIYEVKSTWTYNKAIDEIKLKEKACLDAGYKFELYIFTKRGKRIIM